MDRIIEVKVNGNYLFKDNKNAGVQYEANVTSLRIEFDAGWDGYAKKVTFWDAVGGNPVERTLTTDLLEDITKSTRIYLCPIPGEPMLIAGNMTFVIDGYVGGKRQRSISDKLRVKEAPFKETAGEPADPTPTQAEQLQVQIDGIKSTIQSAVQSADDARASAEAAKNSEIVAESAKNAAETARAKAEEAQSAAESAKTEADAAIATVESAKADAVAAAENAKASETAAKGSEEAAKASETAAGEAKTAAEAAKSGAEAAKSAAEKAEANAGLWSYASAENGQLAADARVAAESAQAAAEAARAGAEAARDQAEAIAGGDFATKPELAAHTGDSNIHVTAEEKAGWNERDVFIARYGTTTSAEIEAAYMARKPIIAIYPGKVIQYHIFQRSSPTLHNFSTFKTNGDVKTIQCSSDVWSVGQNAGVKPSTHATTHASGGTDPITPESIGAATASHTHSEYAPAYTYGTEDLTAGTSELATGKLYFVFE